MRIFIERYGRYAISDGYAPNCDSEKYLFRRGEILFNDLIKKWTIEKKKTVKMMKMTVKALQSLVIFFSLCYNVN